MEKKSSKAVYAPGELSRVRKKLGAIDEAEARRMVERLGGDVGYERTKQQEDELRKPKTGNESTAHAAKGHHSSKHPKHRIDMAELDDADSGIALPAAGENKDIANASSGRLKIPYIERIKMDRYASLPEFDIKTTWQAMVSVLTIFGTPPDYVSPFFVTQRLNEYYRNIEHLVNSTRALFPRNNMKRSEKMKKTSPAAFSILDTIRYWNIERIASDMGRIQSHPRSVRAEDCADILRAVYRPLFILGKLNTEAHIKGAYKILYKVLQVENPVEKEKNQELVKAAIFSFLKIHNDIHYLLYPLLMKLISNRWFPYEVFFDECYNRFMAFLKVSPKDQIDVPIGGLQEETSVKAEKAQEDVKKETVAENTDTAVEQGEENKENDPASLEKKAREADQKALDKGLATMEILFPKAGWEQLGTFPDLYPYFADTLKLKTGYDLIAPTDPMQQVSVLVNILGDFLFALRYVQFGTIIGPDGSHIKVDIYLNSIINNWQRYISDSFDKEYIPRLTDFCQMLEQSLEARHSIYAKHIINELNWVKRLYFLPYYKFENIGPPPFQKADTTPIYKEIKLLRKYLTAVAVGIEQGNRYGGAEAQAPCDGIDNPWQPYNFEVPNPISMRLDMLLAPKKRTNAALVFFCLSAVVVLDYLVNNENSWAYESRSGPLFRSLDGAGIVPVFGVENKLNADTIFRTTHRQRQHEKEQQKGT